MSTAKESSIVPLGKNVMLINQTLANGPNVASKKCISEADYLHLVCKPTVSSGTYFIQVYDVHGDADEHETLLLTTKNTNKSTVADLGYFQITGAFRVELHYTGSVTVQLSATGLRVKEVSEAKIDAVAQELATFQNDQLCLLADIREHLEKMNNHLRMITGVAENDGDKY